MTGFLALLGPTAPPPADGVGSGAAWSSGPVRLWAERSGRPNGPRVAERGPLAVAADARIDNRDDLRRALGASGDDGALLLAAYERWGEGLVDHVEGAFSFALWDGRAGRLVVARDAMGLRPLFRARVGDGWAFGSSLPTVRALVPFRLNTAAAADFLAGDTSDPRQTMTEGVERVPAAHAVVVAPGGAVRERRYWAVDPTVRLPDDDAVVEGAFREAFDRAVAARLDGQTGAFLSGGLDSSSIVTTARALRPAPPLPTFSLIYDERAADERRYIEAVEGGGGVVPHRVAAEAVASLDALDDDLGALGEPSAAPNLFLTRHLYGEAARAGCAAVLDGFGGDNVVGHGTERLTELALGLRWPTLVRETRAAAARTRWPRRAVLTILRDFAVAPLATPLRRPAPVVHFGRRDVVGPRTARVGRAWTVRAPHLAELESPLLAHAAEAAYALATAAGVEPRFPFLDRRVVAVCLAVPSAQRVRHGLTRSFLRRAMGDRLPPAVRERAGKAVLGTNFTDALFDRSAAALRRAVYDDAEAADGVLDLPALREAYARAERAPQTHAALALPLWRAAVFARWMATAPGPRPSVPEGLTLFTTPPAPVGG